MGLAIAMNDEMRFVEAIEGIYTMATNDDGWEVGLRKVSDLLGSLCVSFEVINKSRKGSNFLRMGGEFNRDMEHKYLQYYSGISPRVHRAEDYQAGEVSYDYQILSEQDINKDEYYNDFARPQGQRYFVAGHLLNDSNHIALFAAQRSPIQGHVGDQEIKLVERLLPHVKQALNLKFRLAEVNNPSESTFEHLNALTEAVVVLDRQGKTVFHNELAEALISRRDGIDCYKDRLIFNDRESADNFSGAMNSLAVSEGRAIKMGTRDFIVHRPSRKKPYLVSLRPLIANDLGNNDFSFLNTDKAASLLFIRDPDMYNNLDANALKVSFHLTTQELELALALARGLSLDKVAQMREVAISTVRSQLYSLMSKAGVKKQTDLIRLLGQYRRPFY